MDSKQPIGPGMKRLMIQYSSKLTVDRAREQYPGDAVNATLRRMLDFDLIRKDLADALVEANKAVDLLLSCPDAVEFFKTADRDVIAGALADAVDTRINAESRKAGLPDV